MASLLQATSKRSNDCCAAGPGRVAANLIKQANGKSAQPAVIPKKYCIAALLRTNFADFGTQIETVVNCIRQFEAIGKALVFFMLRNHGKSKRLRHLFDWFDRRRHNGSEEARAKAELLIEPYVLAAFCESEQTGMSRAQSIQALDDHVHELRAKALVPALRINREWSEKPHATPRHGKIGS
jgi:hypothetical protein